MKFELVLLVGLQAEDFHQVLVVPVVAAAVERMVVGCCYFQDWHQVEVVDLVVAVLAAVAVVEEVACCWD